MVAYCGQIKFERERILEHGVGRLLKKAVSGNGARLTQAKGQGRLYLADVGKKIPIRDLAGESIFVNSPDRAGDYSTGPHTEPYMKISLILCGELHKCF